jgi:hypothetical protein
VLFKKETLDQIEAGRVTLAFHRWPKPAVKAGGALRTAAGVLAIVAVDKITAKAIKETDAKRAGYKSRAALMAELESEEGDLYRIAFRRIGADPLIALRKEAKLTKKEMKSVIAALNRLDHASPNGAWTRMILRLIDKYPARRIPDLASSIGRDPMVFKRDVKKLKELGLTEALEVGYRISPRGRVVLAEISTLSSANA